MPTGAGGGEVQLMIASIHAEEEEEEEDSVGGILRRVHWLW